MMANTRNGLYFSGQARSILAILPPTHSSSRSHRFGNSSPSSSYRQCISRAARQIHCATGLKTDRIVT